MNRFSLAKRLLLRSGITPALLGKRAESFILMFHGIGESSGFSGPRFEALLRMLGQIFRFAPLDGLAGGKFQANPGGRPRLFLTFDDGLKNNLTVAHPILERLGIPAVFYVCPGLIDEGRWIWTHEMRARLETLDTAARSRHARQWFGEAVDPGRIVEHMKTLKIGARIETEQAIRDATSGFSPSASQREAFDLMTWSDLEKVNRDLISIGCHSMTHAMLDSVAPDEADVEVRGSRLLLAQKLGREVAHFCYPDGRSSAMVRTLVGQTYGTSVTTRPRSLPNPIISPFDLPRIGADPNPAELAWQLLRAPGAASAK